jgi:hypothetical protein
MPRDLNQIVRSWIPLQHTGQIFFSTEYVLWEVCSLKGTQVLEITLRIFQKPTCILGGLECGIHRFFDKFFSFCPEFQVSIIRIDEADGNLIPRWLSLFGSLWVGKVVQILYLC